jgi:hypothetical protein
MKAISGVLLSQFATFYDAIKQHRITMDSAAELTGNQTNHLLSQRPANDSPICPADTKNVSFKSTIGNTSNYTGCPFSQSENLPQTKEPGQS